MERSRFAKEIPCWSSCSVVPGGQWGRGACYVIEADFFPSCFVHCLLSCAQRVFLWGLLSLFLLWGNRRWGQGVLGHGCDHVVPPHTAGWIVIDLCHSCRSDARSSLVAQLEGMKSTVPRHCGDLRGVSVYVCVCAACVYRDARCECAPSSGKMPFIPGAKPESGPRGVERYKGGNRS